MNAQVFQIVLLFAVLALGLFSFLIGAKATQVRSLKAKGDDHGYHTTMQDLVKICLGSVLVFAATAIIFVTAYIAAPELLMVPTRWIGDSWSFMANVIGGVIISSALGFYAGVCVQEKMEHKTSTGSGIKKFIPAFSVVGALMFIQSVKAAVPMNETMKPVSDILVWAGVDMMPAVLILLLAVVPIVMIMIGVRFAGGMLNGLLDGIREIFSFRF
jgi:hypothetical protein